MAIQAGLDRQNTIRTRRVFSMSKAVYNEAIPILYREKGLALCFSLLTM